MSAPQEQGRKEVNIWTPEQRIAAQRRLDIGESVIARLGVDTIMGEICDYFKLPDRETRVTTLREKFPRHSPLETGEMRIINGRNILFQSADRTRHRLSIAMTDLNRLAVFFSSGPSYANYEEVYIRIALQLTTLSRPIGAGSATPLITGEQPVDNESSFQDTNSWLQRVIPYDHLNAVMK